MSGTIEIDFYDATVLKSVLLEAQTALIERATEEIDFSSEIKLAAVCRVLYAVNIRMEVSPSDGIRWGPHKEPSSEVHPF